MIDILIPTDRNAEVRSKECGDWLLANSTGSVVGYLDGEGRYLMRFEHPEEAEAFRLRWLES